MVHALVTKQKENQKNVHWLFKNELQKKTSDKNLHQKTDNFIDLTH